MKHTGSLLVAVAAAAAVAAQPGREPAPQVTGEIALAADMAEAARRFLSALTPEQRRRATFTFGADERSRWAYTPRARKGLTLGELAPAQRHLAYGFLTTALSRKGFLKASGIMALEEVLRRRSGGSIVRDPEAYHLTIFGEPATGTTWGWRLEGHHLSINVTLVDGVRLVVAPLFLGANPARVEGDFLGHTRTLGREEDLGFQLLASLDDDQRRQAVYRATAPDDILTGPGASLSALPGLPGSRMTAAQRSLLEAIVEEAIGGLPPEQAARERAGALASPDQLSFSWAGGDRPGQPHYYLVSGPTFLYELDNTQDRANHVHTVWHERDAAGGDFGADLLRQHYQAQPHGDLTREERDMEKLLRGEWSRAIEPFRIVGNVYYVGAANIASYLIATSEGLILIDTGTREMEPVVRANIVKLGFKLEDVKILLTSHAHFDHVEGLAAMKKLTGAAVMAMAAEVPALSSGKDLSALGAFGWEPVAVDRVLRDGEEVVLGDTRLRAVWTPGHTQGCTSWTTTARDNRRTYSVAFVGSASPNSGVKLVGNPRHPTIVEDLARTHRALRQLKPDIWLTFHPADQLAGKIERLRAGQEPHPLVDPEGFVKYVEEAEADTARALRAEGQAR